MGSNKGRDGTDHQSAGNEQRVHRIDPHGHLELAHRPQLLGEDLVLGQARRQQRCGDALVVEIAPGARDGREVEARIRGPAPPRRGGGVVSHLYTQR